jgi:hypothetical protein
MVQTAWAASKTLSGREDGDRRPGRRHRNEILSSDTDPSPVPRSPDAPTPASYVIPLAVLELYLRARVSGARNAQLATAVVHLVELCSEMVISEAALQHVITRFTCLRNRSQLAHGRILLPGTSTPRPPTASAYPNWRRRSTGARLTRALTGCEFHARSSGS